MTQEDQNLQSLFANLNQVSRNSMIREKAGGGTGGGSESTEDSMNPNTLMTGNPYIAKNVIEFNQGGMVGASGAPTMNNPYLQKMNALVGLQQMMNVGKGLMSNTLQQETMMSAPKANYGMKIPKYNQGGMTVQEANASGKKYVINKDGSASILDFQGVGPGVETSRVDMDPALLRGNTRGIEREVIRRKYTNGGRF